jgi:TRAP-type mannitol/chloroaromatic compound transport system permease small subunit
MRGRFTRRPSTPDGENLDALLRLSSGIDRVNTFIGQSVRWLVLASVLISAGNAIIRKIFDTSSNAFLEIQWYLFAAVFMLGSGYVMLKNAHVRIDFIASKLSTRTNAMIDLAGLLVFTIPLALILMSLSWPLFSRAFESGEMSANAGGLIRWPVLLLIPVGFAIVGLQAVSEVIKRVAYLRGLRAEPFTPDHEKHDELSLIDEIKDSGEPQGAR